MKEKEKKKKEKENFMTNHEGKTYQNEKARNYLILKWKAIYCETKGKI